MERDRLRLILFPTVYVFQLTRSRGAWPLHSRCHLQILIYFNSHAHVERDGRCFQYPWLLYDFNSHAHVERDHVCMGIFKILEISTHTLTWSVTGSLFKLQDVRCNFNSHAHVERDHFRWCENCKQLHFNSHAHVERDRKMRTFQYQMQISTHTLTWSVTLVHECITGKKHISTHTLTWSVTKTSGYEP